jgi:hypothetical protein
MAQHRAPRRRTRRIHQVVAVLAAFVAIIALPGAANASGAKTARTSDPNVVAKCGLEVTSVNPGTGKETLKLSAQAQPTALSGYANNVFTVVDCSVLNGTGQTQLADFTVSKNGPVIVTTTTTAVIDTQTPLELCVSAAVVLKNGDQSFPATVCQ